MKYYSPAHAVFFEAALADWPTPLLEWLAQDIPNIEKLTGTSAGGMIDRDSVAWKEIVCKAFAEELPDYCINCDTVLALIPGGQIRDGCPKCIEEIEVYPGDVDTRRILRITLTLAQCTEHSYFSEFIEYLLACHIAWRYEKKFFKAVEACPPIPTKASLMDKLRS